MDKEPLTEQEVLDWWKKRDAEMNKLLWENIEVSYNPRLVLDRKLIDALEKGNVPL